MSPVQNRFHPVILTTTHCLRARNIKRRM
jgi:hypothetical protein